MKTYVVASFDAFEGKICLKQIRAENPQQAYIKALNLIEDEFSPRWSSYTKEMIENALIECDMVVAITEIKNLI